jgi:hypothetical protein
MTAGLAQFLTVKKADGGILHRWQNHWFNQRVEGHEFAPFNVNSLISKASDGAESIQIELPPTADNLELTELGLQRFYIATVEQYQFTPPASGLPTSLIKIASFTGEFQSAEFGTAAIALIIGSNLDSTESQAPPRTFTTTLTGFPPKL